VNEGHETLIAPSTRFPVNFGYIVTLEHDFPGARARTIPLIGILGGRSALVKRIGFKTFGYRTANS
jgi:hypothetical protein